MNKKAYSPVQRSTFSILSVTAAAVLALAACSPDDGSDQITSEQDDTQVEDTPSPETEDETTPDVDVEDEATGDHPVYQALEAAMAEYPDGVVTDFDHENSYIEVTVIDGETEWDLDIDADGTISNTQEEPADADDIAEAEAVEVDIVEALQTAESETGAAPRDGSLDTEAGSIVWEFEMDNGTDVYIDVATGEVVGTGTDDDD